MLAGIRITRLDRVGQRSHRCHVRALELLCAFSLLLERLAQVGRVPLQLALLVGRLLLAPAELRAQPLDLLDELRLAPHRHHAQRTSRASGGSNASVFAWA